MLLKLFNSIFSSFFPSCFRQVPEGRLKLRFHENRDSQLIFYTRSNQSGPKLSDFHLAATKTPDDLSNVLERALGVRGEVKKTRWLYMVGQTRVHCDRVDGLGDFAELEVLLNDDQTTSDGEKIAHDLMEKLGIKQDDLIAGAYMDLIEAKTNGN